MGDSPYTDLDRPPLNERALRRMLLRPGAFWREIRLVPETGSTNADLAEAAHTGAPEGTVLIAEAQTAGRGRLGRTWTAPPRSGLMFSVLLRPDIPVARLGWVPLLTGVAVATAVRRMTGREEYGDKALEAGLKWPNDVLIADRKLAGILVERVDGALIVGVGLNVSLRETELPVPEATSLALEDAAVDREALLRAVLRELAASYQDWTALEGDPEASGLRSAYKGVCVTLGRAVRVELPGDQVATGTALDVDDSGRLVVRTGGPAADLVVSAGDVVHVR